MVTQTCQYCEHVIEWNQKKDGSGSYPINPRVNGKFTFHSIYYNGKKTCSLDGETPHDPNICGCKGQTKLAETPKPKTIEIEENKILLARLEVNKDILGMLQEIKMILEEISIKVGS